MIVVTSWDDGHPEDVRIAELLDKHGLTGTFYVPGRNSEGWPIMPRHDLRTLADRFEIGSHTLNHVPLHKMDREAVRTEIAGGKAALEDMIGKPITGFCYPQGKIPTAPHGVLRELGITHARTVENFRLDAGIDRYMIPTTVQLYPHPRFVYVKNLISRGRYGMRLRGFLALFGCRSLRRRLEAVAASASGKTAVFHLWGHSWEFGDHDLWTQLDQVLGQLKALDPKPMTVGALAETIGAAE